jgi:hypothetical protein
MWNAGAPCARGGAGGHAGRAGARVGRESSARARACRTPRPKCCPISRSEVDSLCTRTGPAAAERCGASVLVVNLSAGRTCLWSAIDGSRTTARDRRRDGLGTFACAAAFDRHATHAEITAARRHPSHMEGHRSPRRDGSIRLPALDGLLCDGWRRRSVGGAV